MPEPDPGHARLAEPRQRLEALGLRVNAAPVGSPERDRLAEQFGEVLGGVLALAEELEPASSARPAREVILRTATPKLVA